MRTRRRGRVHRLQVLAGILALAAVVAINGPLLLRFAQHIQHQRLINSASYKRRNGHWSILPVPASKRVNAIHAALLYTGKVLIIAGSGNDAAHFEAGKFESILWDPKTDKFKKIATPVDMFCGGHAFLPDGKLLIAGGTSRYEALPEPGALRGRGHDRDEHKRAARHDPAKGDDLRRRGWSLVPLDRCHRHTAGPGADRARRRPARAARGAERDPDVGVVGDPRRRRRDHAARPLPDRRVAGRAGSARSRPGRRTSRSASRTSGARARHTSSTRPPSATRRCRP